MVNAAYEGPQFHGERALHFAVVHRDLWMVKLLVEAGAEIDAHADGIFFFERVSMYFGGRAVGLAANLDEHEILEYLADKVCGRSRCLAVACCLLLRMPPT